MSDLERKLGEATKEAFALQYGLIENPLLNNWLNRIGEKLSQSAGVGVRFYIVDSEEINAYATFGDLVFLTKGLLKIVESEDELACVLAHEVAHIKLKHPQKQSGIIALSLILLSSLDLKEKEELLARSLLVLANLGFSRSQEKEADEKGIEIALRSGFNPRGLLNFLGRLGGEKVPRWAEYLATHPSASRRVEIFQRKLDTISQEKWEKIYSSLWERGEAKEGREFPHLQTTPPPEEPPSLPLSNEKLSLLWEQLHRIHPLCQRISQWQSSLILTPVPYEILSLIGEALAQNDRLKELYAQASLLYNNVNILADKLLQEEVYLEEIFGDLISALDKGKQAGERLLLSSAALTGLSLSGYTGDLSLLSLQSLLLASGKDIAKATKGVEDANNLLLPFQIEFLVRRLNSLDNEWLRRKCSHRLGLSLGEWEGMPLGDLCLLASISLTLAKPMEESKKLWGTVSGAEEMMDICGLKTRDREAIYIFLNSLAKGN